MTEPEAMPTGEPISESVAADPDADAAPEGEESFQQDSVYEGGEAVTEAKKAAASPPPAAVPEPASPEGADPEALNSIGEDAGDFGAAQAAEEEAASKIAELQHMLDATEQKLIAEEQMTEEINGLMKGLDYQLK